MTEENDLFQTLHCEKIDQTEFEQIVGSYFGHGSYASPQEIYHATTNKGCALRALYNEDGKLTKVLAGPDIEYGQIDALLHGIGDGSVDQVTSIRLSRRQFKCEFLGTTADRLKDIR
jgi:hypothetical protein